MTTDITYIIADFLRQANPELESRIGYQSEALQEAKCTNPAIGKFTDENDVKYLLSALALEDKDFAVIFPQLAYVKKDERQRLAETIESHFDYCQHCALKRGYDLEIDAQIKKICLQNKDSLLKLLEDSTDLSEGEHQKQIAEENETDSSEEEENYKFSAHL